MGCGNRRGLPADRHRLIISRRMTANRETTCLTGGGGGIAVRERQIQLRKMAGKLQGNCGASTKAPEASRSNSSAEGTHRAPTSTQGGQAKRKRKIAENCRKLRKIAENRGKLREVAENCGKLRKIAEKLRTIRTPTPAPLGYHVSRLCFIKKKNALPLGAGGTSRPVS